MAGHNQRSILETAAPAGRALVAGTSREVLRRDERPSAGFVTQLIASDRRLPAYRRAGRADPDTATALYRQTGFAPLRILDRVV